jgi:hypothetical protein
MMKPFQMQENRASPSLKFHSGKEIKKPIGNADVNGERKHLFICLISNSRMISPRKIERSGWRLKTKAEDISTSCSLPITPGDLAPI